MFALKLYLQQCERPDGRILGQRAAQPTCRLPAAYSLIIIHVYNPASRGTVRRASCMRDEQTAAADVV